MTERRVRFTATAQKHVVREQQWWVENRGSVSWVHLTQEFQDWTGVIARLV